MGLLLQGGKRGAVSGTLGLTIFDMLNGYMQDAPKTFVETAVKCLIVGALFMMLKKKADGDKKKEYGAAVVCAFIYGCINVIMEFTMSTIAMMMVGSGFAAAAVAAFTSLPATVINAVFMVIAIAILYQPVKKIYVRMAQKGISQTFSFGNWQILMNYGDIKRQIYLKWCICLLRF